jgi:hypothetical protein
MHGYAEHSNRQSRVEADLALWISDPQTTERTAALIAELEQKLREIDE